MNKIISIIVITSIFFLPSNVHGALNFTNATSDRVLVNAAASVDTLATASFIMWVYPTSITANRSFVRKGNLVSTGWNFGFVNASGDFRAQIGRPTRDDYSTNSAPMPTANKWYCFAITWDINAAAGQRINIYTGDLTTPLAEATYSSTNSGSGIQANDSGVNINIGNIPTSHNAAFPGYIANTIMLNRTLTLGELRSLQYNPRVVSGTVGYWQLGYNGTGTQTDYSGKNNSGTVTGATVTGHVPLRQPFGM